MRSEVLPTPKAVHSVCAKVVRAQIGFTLVELLVVIAIMVALATLAVRNLDTQIDQGSFDKTQRQLNEIEIAVLGPQTDRQSDGALIASGFMSDMGRPPLAVTVSSTLHPQELWYNTNSMRSFSVIPATTANIHMRYKIANVAGSWQLSAPTIPFVDELDVNIPCGWRGPYLRLPYGSVYASYELKDGWNNPFRLFATDGITALTANDKISQITSYAADNALGGTGYNTDLPAVVFMDTGNALLPNKKIIGSVTTTDPDLSHTIYVRIFGPDPDDGYAGYYEQEINPASGTQFEFPLMSFDTLTNRPVVNIGYRVLRAYQNGKGGDVRPLVITTRYNQTIVLKAP